MSALASSIDVPVYIVATVPPIDRPDAGVKSPEPSTELYDLARWTGGEFMWVSDNEDGAATTQQILSDLRHQYVIAIEAAAAAEWRPLDVRVRRHNLTVRTRGGYFSGR